MALGGGGARGGGVADDVARGGVLRGVKDQAGGEQVGKTPVGQHDAPILVGVVCATLDDATEAVNRVSHLATDADFRANV